MATCWVRSSPPGCMRPIHAARYRSACLGVRVVLNSMQTRRPRVNARALSLNSTQFGAACDTSQSIKMRLCGSAT